MSDEPTPRPIRIDAHQHFWPQPTRFLYPWMTDEQAALRRPFGPDDLRPLIQSREIDWTVLVQTRSSLDETRDFLAIADKTEFVAGEKRSEAESYAIRVRTTDQGGLPFEKTLTINITNVNESPRFAGTAVPADTCCPRRAIARSWQPASRPGSR